METTPCGLHVAALITLVRTRPATQRAPGGRYPPDAGKVCGNQNCNAVSVACPISEATTEVVDCGRPPDRPGGPPPDQLLPGRGGAWVGLEPGHR